MSSMTAPLRVPLDGPALSAPGRISLTHDGLRRQVENVARALAAWGIGPRGRVALLARQTPETAAAIAGLTATVTCAPLNPGLRATEYDFLLGDLEATALVTPAGSDSPALAVARARGIALIELSPAGEAGAFELSSAPSGGRRGERPGDRDDVALVLHTSGTTSRPKLICLTRANLAASTRNIAAALELSGADRCLTVMPLFHIHGIMVTLAALSVGGEVVCPGPFTPEGFFDAVAAYRPTWYSAVPTLHRAVLDEIRRRPDRARAASFRFIRSSSAPLPTAVATELEEALGAPVIEAYGMTEAAHQIASNPLPPRARKPGSVGLPVGIEAAVLDAEGRPLPPGEPGEIAIRGENVAATGGDGWLRTGDQGVIDRDGYLFITGRLKELINRGGEKVSPQEIDEALSRHPAVAQAMAFGLPHPTLGEDVAAAVILREASTVSVMELRHFAAERLADFKIPGRIFVVDALPTGPTGKVQRRLLSETFAERDLSAVPPPPTSSSSAVPRTRTEEQLAKLAAEVLGADSIGLDDDFFALGGDSIRAGQLVARIRAGLSVEVPLRAVFLTRTVRLLGEAIDFFSPSPRDS